MKQTRPFEITITRKLKRELQALTDEDGFMRGICFDTSGKAHIERVRESAGYPYHCTTTVKCTVCGGSGELKDAVQAWDVPGATVPECSFCTDGRMDLRQVQMMRKEAMAIAKSTTMPKD